MEKGRVNKMTNADRIRNMTDEEIADFIVLSPQFEFEPCFYCINHEFAGQCKHSHCIAEEREKAVLKWLKIESK